MSEQTERDVMEVDVVIVGGGPSGLAAACRLGQLAQESGQELSIVLVEKGSEVGAHIVSGAVMDPKAITELFPNWKELGAPLNVEVTKDEVLFMKNDSKAMEVPAALVPDGLHNDGNYIISLGNLCRWLAEQAEAMGIEVFPGFPAASVIYEDGVVKGIITGDFGVDKEGKQKDGFMPGMELRAKYTLFSEGCRGHLGKELIGKFGLDKDSEVQHYGLGVKEIWEIDPSKHELGKVVHTTGWPLSESKSYGGGGFLYHIEDNQVSLGLITSLSYQNPYVSPFEEMQRWKTHPAIKQVLEGGKRISYGARAVTKGGYQSIPRCHFPGGLLSGCDAGFMNMARIKGSHTAMKSGMLAAETLFASLASGDEGGKDLTQFQDALKSSWLYEELYTARNVSPAITKHGDILGGAMVFVDQKLFKGKLPITLSNPTPDYAKLQEAKNFTPIDYPKPDSVLTFNRLDSVFISNTNHEEDQLCHLQLGDPSLPISVNLPKWAEPAQRYCPAGVYEVVEDEAGARFQINAQNCIHCKTCDIKDPSQNINWVVPEGGGGPNYPNM